MTGGKRKVLVTVLFFLLCGIAYTAMHSKGMMEMGTEAEPAAVLSMTAEEVASKEQGSDWKININEAGQAELMMLEGIGEKISQRIIDYRQQYGPFLQIEDIMKVSGIGEKTFENIKDNITVE